MSSQPGVAPQKLLIATNNQGKLRELARLMSDIPYDLVSLKDVGISHDVEETGSTFEENAILKATEYARLSGLPTLADDSGLEVDALSGEPGVRSARYAGEGAPDAEKIAFLLQKLNNRGRGPGEWTARFRCVVALVLPGQEPRLFEGTCEGRVIDAPRGTNGFGYDPVFLFPDLGRTMAELSPEEKNSLSHRGKAARKAAEALKHAHDSGQAE